MKNHNNQIDLTLLQTLDLGSTGSEKLGSPLTLKSKLNVLDAADFDENESTITLNLLFTILWTDVRLRLESNKPNE